MQDLVYLAGPVDGVSEPERSGWRQAMGHALIRRGLIGYSPAAPWMAAQEEAVEHASTVDAINRHVINRSVGLIANLAGVGRGIGTIREIEYASVASKPVLVLVPIGLPPTVALMDVFTWYIDQPSFWADDSKLDTVLDEWLHSWSRRSHAEVHSA